MSMDSKWRTSTRAAAAWSVLLLLVLLWPNADAFAQVGNTPYADRWVTNGPVRTIATTPAATYIGGQFTHVGPNTGCGVPIGTGTGTPAATYPKVNGVVYTSIPDGVGGWYIGGGFTRVGTAPRNRIAHILANGEVDAAWNPNADNTVYALALSGRTVYAGGAFARISGAARSRLAALDATTGLATGWKPSASDAVFAIAVSGDMVYVGGDFTSIGMVYCDRIAEINITTGGATSWWTPDANGRVNVLCISGTSIYVGGDFTSIGHATRNHIAQLAVKTGGIYPWNPGADGPVVALAVSGTTLYAGGNFTTIGGQPRNSIAAVDITDLAPGIATDWNPGADDQVCALAISGTTLYAGGNFTSIGGAMRDRLAALDTATGLVSAWNPAAGNQVQTLAVSGATVYAGGNFPSIGGVTRNNIAALDAAGVATDWDPNAYMAKGNNPDVSALAVSGTTVYAAGHFTSIGGAERNRIAALDAATGLATAWNPNANNDLSALAVSGTTVYAGGYFTSIGGQPRNQIAALDAATGLATAWDPNANSDGYSPYAYVSALAVLGTTVYAAGHFTTIGGQPRNQVAALDAATGLATAWNPNANAVVRALAVSGTTVYAGGYFTSIGGASRNRLAALDSTTGLATAWNPNANAVVRALAVSGSEVYAGGEFTTIGGQARNRLASLGVTTGFATAWNPDVNGIVLALALSGSTAHAGGQFTSIGSNMAPNYAQFDLPPTAALSLITPSPSSSDTVVFTVAFSEPVGTFTGTDVQVTGTLAGAAAVTGADPNYTVSVTLANPNANGTCGITLPGGVITDLAGNPYAGGSSTLCTVQNWSGFRQQPQGAKLYAGDAHTLAVQVDEAGLPTSYLWKFNNGTTVTDGAAAARWPLTNVALVAAGTYWCEVTCGGVPHTGNAVTVQVQPRVHITTPPAGGSATAGGAYTFTVAAAGGYGPLSYQWKKGVDNIDGANGTEYTRADLTLDDGGDYSVEISDTNGDSDESTPVTLTVSAGIPVLGAGGLVLLAAVLAAAARRKVR